MRLTIFSRLIFGYLAIILIMGVMDAYTITKLHRLNSEVSKILDIDERILELKRRLTGSIISQSGYEQKYFITGDPVFREQFAARTKDFNESMAQASALADTDQKRSSLTAAKSEYEKYQSLVDRKMRHEEMRQDLTESRRTSGEEKMVGRILAELNALESFSRADIHHRMSTLRETAHSTTKVTVFMVIITLLLAIATSITVTHHITSPLKILIQKTKEVSRGIFRGGLRIASPPEVSELADTFDLMCEKLRQVDKIKSEFFSDISHELRTPLTAIKTGISLLKQSGRGPITDKQERLLTILSEESNRLINLVNTVMDLSKMEAGMMAYNFREEHFIAFIEQVITEMTPLFEAKKIHLRTDLNRSVPPMQLDRERILQALRNLIGNAVKFTPNGGQISISAGPKEGKVAFSVRDSGPGIPQENLDTIFEKFHQAPLEASQRLKGTGLGLALVKHIITSHGGTVWAESETGQGSVFTFVLPC